MIKVLFYIFLGGGLGSVCRFLIGKSVIKFYQGIFPIGTLIANLISCVLVGVIVYLFAFKMDTANKGMYLLLITGFCGGLSTFSTFGLETFELLRQGNLWYAILNVVISLVVGLGALYILYNKSLN